MFTEKCFDFRAYCKGISGAHVGLDIIILCMPFTYDLGLEATYDPEDGNSRVHSCSAACEVALNSVSTGQKADTTAGSALQA